MFVYNSVNIDTSLQYQAQVWTIYKPSLKSHVRIPESLKAKSQNLLGNAVFGLRVDTTSFESNKVKLHWV